MTAFVPGFENDLFISYTTDTLPGSSGSPAFNYDWELVAVHHSSVPRMNNGEILTKSGTVWKKGMPDTDIEWVANEGARVSKVHRFLGEARLKKPEQQAMLAALTWSGPPSEDTIPESISIWKSSPM